MRTSKLLLILYFVSCSLIAGVPEKLADFNLNSKREAEKLGLTFYKAVETAGALQRAIFISDGGYIRIPTYPSFRTQDMTPELNLDIEQGSLEFRFSPVQNWNENTPCKVLFDYNSIGNNQPGMTLYYESGKFLLDVKDQKGGRLRAESEITKLKAGKFYSIAITWSINSGSSESEVKIYFDNKQIAVRKGTLDNMGIAPTDFFIGSAHGNKAATGTYDEIKLWSICRSEFDMKEDSLEEKLKNARPIKMVNFDSVPQADCKNDPLLGKCLVLPNDFEIDELLGFNQGMIEFWLKPLDIGKHKIEVCKLGDVATLDLDNDSLCLKWNEQVLKTESKLKMNNWNAVSLMWNLADKKIQLYLNGKSIGKLKMEHGVPSSSRLHFSFKHGKALLKGVTIWHAYLPQKNLYDKGFRLTGNSPRDFQPLLQFDLPVSIPGEYRYSNTLNGIIDQNNSKGPFSFSTGKLTDGEIGTHPRDRVSFNNLIEIVFDLKKTYFINETIVYCACRPNWYTEKIEFYTSINGKTWIPAGAAVNNAPDYRVQAIVPYQMKIRKEARFLKLKPVAKSGCYVSISDVLIFGLPEKNYEKYGND